MNVDEMFMSYPDNLIGVRVSSGVKIIDFWLDKDWSILEDHVPESVNIKKQKTSEETGDIYYIMFSDAESFTFKELYTILKNIIEYNLDLEKKQQLFTEKMSELKGLFGKLTYEELKQLSFDTPLSIIGGSKKNKNKKIEPQIEEPKEDPGPVIPKQEPANNKPVNRNDDDDSDIPDPSSEGEEDYNIPPQSLN